MFTSDWRETANQTVIKRIISQYAMHSILKWSLKQTWLQQFHTDGERGERALDRSQSYFLCVYEKHIKL